MLDTDFLKLLSDTEDELLSRPVSVGILGLNHTAARLFGELKIKGLHSRVNAIYQTGAHVGYQPFAEVIVQPIQALGTTEHDVLVVAADREKEELLLEALPYISNTPKVIVAGYSHLEFVDSTFSEELHQLLVPSLANGYPNTLVHLYQCLVNSARLGIEGTVAEFGMFKGGTTMFLSRIIERLEQPWHVIGFDTFGGFPARRSPLDMYDHPECVFTDLDAVRRYLEGRQVEIVAGNIVETSIRLKNEDLVLSFIDTDNYSSARAALEVVQDRTVVGGSIVFDHFTGVDRFRYTLGERIAGRVLLDDDRYFHLHGTGVFYRQR
ncbi:TylF/MycF family methyltransferase [Glycomyces sp. A-F 0318]|uniref:TylF/MycF family methyltransferase n=1 Tax=Glycomyces amatae TaxID=2881355 RepID=UPI001E49AA9D|nr:TylF/MycF family methyltransferase [Glycomyces amatae]MCD0446246.1 TylF/MycF family methyltransferase [Glycomyces amatae]